MDSQLSRGQANDWRTGGRTDNTQTRATTIPGGQNWHRVKIRTHRRTNGYYIISWDFVGGTPTKVLIPTNKISCIKVHSASRTCLQNYIIYHDQSIQFSVWAFIVHRPGLFVKSCYGWTLHCQCHTWVLFSNLFKGNSFTWSISSIIQCGHIEWILLSAVFIAYVTSKFGVHRKNVIPLLFMETLNLKSPILQSIA